MLRIILTVIQVIASAAIIGLVLLQRGKGADAGAGFGAGASGTVFGAKGATTALSRATAIFAAIFMINSLALAYMGTRLATEQPKTILDEAATPATATPAPGGAPSITVPGGGVAPSAAPAAGGAPPANEVPAPANGGAAPSSTVPAPATPTK